MSGAAMAPILAPLPQREHHRQQRLALGAQRIDDLAAVGRIRASVRGFRRRPAWPAGRTGCCGRCRVRPGISRNGCRPLNAPRRIRNAHFSPISSIDGGSGQCSAASRNASMSRSLTLCDHSTAILSRAASKHRALQNNSRRSAKRYHLSNRGGTSPRRASFALATAPPRPHIVAVLRQYELIEKIRAYDPDADEGLINRAYVFSMKAHGAQMRASRRPLFQPPDRGRRHPHRPEARRRDDRHRDPPRHHRGHGRHARSRSRNCSATMSRGWSTASPSSARSRRSRRMSAPPRICASSCSRCPTTSACCWSSLPTGCTTCARSITSQARRSGAASPRRRWISMPRSPSGSACTRS